MIRRTFWLALGAAAGVSGYRKASRALRAWSAARPAAQLARGTGAAARFFRDVREGMRLYRLAGSRAASTLERRPDLPDRAFVPAAAGWERSGKPKDGH